MPKITVKHYLNNKLKAVEYTPKNGTSSIQVEETVLAYPLYILVTYNGKNTRFRSILLNKEYETFEFIEKDEEARKLLRVENNIIREIVEYEVSKYGDKFNINGFSKRYALYMKPIHFILDNYLKSKLAEVCDLHPHMHEYMHVINFFNPLAKLEIVLSCLEDLITEYYGNVPDTIKEQLDARDKFFEYESKFKEELQVGHILNIDYPKVFYWLTKSYRERFLKYLQNKNIDSAAPIFEYLDEIIKNQIRALEITQ